MNQLLRQMVASLFKKRNKVNFAIFICLLFIFAFASAFIPKVNIFTKCAVAKIAQSALYIYDPFEDSAKGKEEALISDGFVFKETELSELLSNFNIKVLTFRNYADSNIDYKFYYQNFNEPKLQKLSEKYNLVRFRSNSDFIGFLAVKDWLRQKYSHGSPAQDITYYNFDSLKVLDEIDEGGTLDCGCFSYIFVQCVLSIGGQARVVLLYDETGKGHVVSEVWSNDWGKWIVIDVDHNLYYERNGKPLNALELHNAFIHKNYEDTKIIRGPPLKKDKQKYNLGKELSKYYNFAVRMRNDFFNKYPRWHYKGNLYTNCVQWMDRKTGKLSRYIYSTNKKEDLYWDMNETTVYFKLNGDFALNKLLNLYLQTFTPNFKCFSIVFDGQRKEITHLPELTWNLHPGFNSLEVSSVTQAGLRGKESRIDLFLAK